MTYLKARYYNAEIGRFYGIDPLWFTPDNVQMFGRYTYANNNPFKYTDPTGERGMTDNESGHIDGQIADGSLRGDLESREISTEDFSDRELSRMAHFAAYSLIDVEAAIAHHTVTQEHSHKSNVQKTLQNMMHTQQLKQIDLEDGSKFLASYDYGDFSTNMSEDISVQSLAQFAQDFGLPHPLTKALKEAREHNNIDHVQTHIESLFSVSPYDSAKAATGHNGLDKNVFGNP